ncbi:hypothetical protein A7U60_g6645 [Sanghuangporus baumii]|uniref:Yeast cell wall synthesis Kre9/Knh1-like N-terminal domain-containing protein n=1 Tax=Sanghuangporus baumii TaxID=108892 RepID=A0A9Q5HUT5_SANBA|nr:hypothetical protein A7U60_g6645 [Sanghuangporus baumii]
MSKALFLAIVLPALAVLAQVEPLDPAPGNVYNTGTDCEVVWATDPTGQWTTMNIELMTGSNSQMVHLTTVATVDGTKDTRYSFTCPSVTVNSAIYFYQFSTPAAPGNLTWTGRFAIADASGKTVDPPEEQDGIAFGTGALSDPSTASPAPTYLGDAVSTTVSGANGTSTGSTSVSVVQTVISNSATGALTATGSLTTTGSTAATRSDAANQVSGTASGSDPAASSQSTASGASLVLDIKSRSLQALAGLIGTALVFTAVL